MNYSESYLTLLSEESGKQENISSVLDRVIDKIEKDAKADADRLSFSPYPYHVGVLQGFIRGLPDTPEIRSYIKMHYKV